jgi:hypothetical protein
MDTAMEVEQARRSGGAPGVLEKCLLCQCRLCNDGDDSNARLCSSCKGRPEARRLGSDRTRQAKQSNAARDFTDAEKALIRKIHGYMPPAQLLGILNERLASDLGPDAMPYSMDQLYAEIGDVIGAASAGPRDWPSLRKLLAQARCAGTLQATNEQVIQDFCIVYSLNSKQAMVLKDILLGERS